MAHDVINDDPSVRILVDADPNRFRKSLPLTINVIDEANEGRRSVGRSKGHDCIRPFDRVGALKRQLFLAGLGDCKLMISGWGVE